MFALLKSIKCTLLMKKNLTIPKGISLRVDSYKAIHLDFS